MLPRHFSLIPPRLCELHLVFASLFILPLVAVVGTHEVLIILEDDFSFGSFLSADNFYSGVALDELDFDEVVFVAPSLHGL